MCGLIQKTNLAPPLMSGIITSKHTNQDSVKEQFVCLVIKCVFIEEEISELSALRTLLKLFVYK
jgi:hypothetical protein